MTTTPWSEPEEIGTLEARYAFTRGGEFILNQPETPTALWGRGEHVIQAAGEALIIAGPQGLGKTTLGQQYALGRCGFPEYSTLLGFPVVPTNRRVLYLAMDRPRQASRSMRRMVGEAWRDDLNDRLTVWSGPPPFDFAKDTSVLMHMCREADASHVLVDSIKDAALGLNDDAVGAAYNRARQRAIEDGVEVTELHHSRKKPQGAKNGEPTIDDVYGSTWITSGAGSVLLLTGQPGDTVIGLHQLKAPATRLPTLRVTHDPSTGRSSIWETRDLIHMAAHSTVGLTVKVAAQALYDTDTPTRAQIEATRRQLDRHVKEGQLRPIDGDKRNSTPTTYTLNYEGRQS